MDSKIIVTIGRQIGGGGFVIGDRLAKALNVPFYDKELINLIAEKSGISREVIETYDEKAAQSLFHSAWSVPMHSNERPLGQQLFFAQCDAIRDVAKEGSSVILGRCADYALSGNPDVVRVFLYAPMEVRVQRIMKRMNLQEKAARKYIEKIEKCRKNNYHFFTDREWGENETYDLCLNTATASADAIVGIICAYLELRAKDRAAAAPVTAAIS